MSSNNGEPKEQKGKTQYFTNLDEHESLYLETRESGQVGIKYYQYKKIVNPMAFASMIEMVEKSLNEKGYYIEGRSENATVQGEVKDNAKLEAQLTVDGNNVTKVVDTYIAERKKIDLQKGS